MTHLQAGEGILTTSASKHSAGINTAESEFTPLPLARLIAGWTPLKISKARTSNIVWLRCQKASTKVIGALMVLPLVGFNCRPEEAEGEKGCRVEFEEVKFTRSSTWARSTVGPVTSPFSSDECIAWGSAPSPLCSCVFYSLVMAPLSAAPAFVCTYRCQRRPRWVKLGHCGISLMAASGLGRSVIIAFANGAPLRPTCPPVSCCPPPPPHPRCHLFSLLFFLSFLAFTSPTHLFLLFLLPHLRPPYQIKPKCLPLWPCQPGRQTNISFQSLYRDKSFN